VLTLRFMGKRGKRNISPFQTAVIIALGSAAGDSMFYPHVPLRYALVIITVVVAFHRALAIAQTRAKAVNSFLEGNPLIVVKDGAVLPAALRKARLRPDELVGMLREQGIENTGVIRYAFFERSGKPGVYQFSQDEELSGESTFPVQTERE